MVFFFKQKTAYEMRIRDWSSDVCSSDLSRLPPLLPITNHGSFFIACPPNSLRIADSSLLANESPSRERRRAISDWVITGAGTSRSIASATVQRPSPESGQNGAMPSIVGVLSKNGRATGRERVGT